MSEIGETGPTCLPTPAQDLRWLRASNERFRPLISPVFEEGQQRSDITRYEANDVLYGTFRFDCNEPGDAALISLFYSEPFRRLDFLHQLIMPVQFSHRAETSDFTTGEHSTTCALLARRLGGSAVQQIRAAIHDLAKNSFGHLDDWRAQGFGGPEDYHDTLLRDQLVYWGLDKMFASHGFPLETIVGPFPPDFVENPAPDLCVDRVDYALREFARWACPADVPALVAGMEVREDKIVLKNQELARIFAENYFRLYNSWTEQEFATKEKLFLILIEYGIEKAIITEEDMRTVDQHVLVKLELWGDKVVHNMLWLLRRPRLTIAVKRGLGFDEDELRRQPDKLYVPMRSLKKRWVDPSFVDDDSQVRKLTEKDPAYRVKIENFLASATTEFWEQFVREHTENERWSDYAEIEVEPDLKQVLLETGRLF